jgi:dihydrolipoamide dehydrogenase
MPPIETINLHPSTHPPSSLKSTTYDVIFLGAGWPSRITGPRCVAAGLSVLTIEKELIGGDCRFWACIPSKALLRSAEALETSSHLPGARERRNSVHVDSTAVFAHRDTFTANWSDTADIVPTMEGQGVTLVRGHGRIAGVKKVRVTLDSGGAHETVDFQARLAVVINTGSIAGIPDIPGLHSAVPWTPREATSSSMVPETLFVMGGGVVGVEMATIYLSLGSKVVHANSSSELLT